MALALVGTVSASFGNMVASYADYVDVRNRSQSFDGLVAFTNSTVGFAHEPDALPALRIGMLVSGNFFSVMGVSPILGRPFSPDEGERGDQVVVLSYGLWQRQFGSLPDARQHPGNRWQEHKNHWCHAGQFPVPVEGISALAAEQRRSTLAHVLMDTTG